MWGPFWILATLIVILSFSTAWYKFLRGGVYSFTTISFNAGFIFFLGFVTPLVCGLLMKCWGLGSSVNIIGIISVYGYA